MLRPRLVLIFRLVKFVFLAGIIALFVLVWSWSPYAPLTQLRNISFSPLGFSSDGKVLVVGTPQETPGNPTSGGNLRFLRIPEMTEIGNPIELPAVSLDADGRGWMLHGIVPSPDNAYLAIPGCADLRSGQMSVLVYDWSSGALVSQSTFATPLSRDCAVAFSADSRRLIKCETGEGFYDPRIVLTDLTQKRTLFSHADEISPTFRPNSEEVLCLSIKSRGERRGNPAIRFCDAWTGKLHREFVIPETIYGFFPLVSHSPDGGRVAIGTILDGWEARIVGGNKEASLTGHRIYVLDSESGKEVAQLPGWCPVFLADNRTLLLAHGRAIQLIDTASWQTRETLELLNERFGTMQSLSTGLPDMRFFHGFGTPTTSPNTVLLFDDFGPEPGMLDRILKNATLASLPVTRWLVDRFGWDEPVNERVLVVDGRSARHYVFPQVRHTLVGCCVSLDGSRIAFTHKNRKSNHTCSIYDIPPRRSLLPILSLGALLATLTGIGYGLRWLWGRRTSLGNAVVKDA